MDISSIIIKILQLIFSLSILVIFHELGHFLFAKLFKTKVEKFYLFFDYKFSLLKKKIGDTEYGIGWIPLGGYVKIAGMIDESLDKEQIKNEPKPFEYRAKPAWQRLLIITGGVLFNIILAIIIYIALLFFNGSEYIPTSNLKYGIHCDSLAIEMGLQNGDKIISVDNKHIENFAKIPEYIILNNAKTIQVIRNNKPHNVIINQKVIPKLLKSKSPFIEPLFPFEVAEFTQNSTAKKAGIQKGDIIKGINDKYLPFFNEFRKEIVKHKNQTVKILLTRNNHDTVINVTLNETGLLGIAPNINKYIITKQKEYSIIEAIPAGFLLTFDRLNSYVKQLKLLFSPHTKAYDSLGGFITIGSIFPSTWNWDAFWNLTAFLSIILAVMNILPIPALDGGHMLFIIYELITRRKPNEKFLEYAQITGMAILIALVIWANMNDVLKLFR